jgi:acetyltransferase-like isoleucine patch superfamily enzyme
MLDMIKIIYSKLFNKFLYPNSTVASYIPRGCTIGQGVKIGKRVQFNAILTVDDYTFIGDHTRFDTKIEHVGKFCSISHDVSIGLGQHPHNWVSTSPVFYSINRGYVNENIYLIDKQKKSVIIENDVLIGANSIILAGVTISNGAVIGAGSVVTRDIPPYAIVAGNPAKILKYRFNDKIINLLLESKWWEKDINCLLHRIDMIQEPEEFIRSLKADE